MQPETSEVRMLLIVDERIIIATDLTVRRGIRGQQLAHCQNLIA